MVSYEYSYHMHTTPLANIMHFHKSERSIIAVMTDMDRTRLAKTYIEKLSYGLNPLTDLPVAENDIINNVHISRCLMYVVGVLGQVIDNGGVERHSKARKKPFSINFEQRERFEFSRTPITISEIARRMNTAAGGGVDCTQLRYSSITFWLIKIGMLAVQKHADGKETKIPTEQGGALGISVQMREGVNGAYNVVVYDEAAQHFIVDNIDAIVKTDNMRFEMQGQPWRSEDDALLQTLAERGLQVYEIALQLKRNSASVRARLRKLGIEH